MEAFEAARRGMGILADLTRRVHRRPPGILTLRGAADHPTILAAAAQRDALERLLAAIGSDRLRRDLKEVKRWAKLALVRELHRASKPIDEVVKKTASPSKEHRGERTPQAAADSGCKDWSRVWKASRRDTSEQVMLAIEALCAVGRRENDLDELILPPPPQP